MEVLDENSIVQSELDPLENLDTILNDSVVQSIKHRITEHHKLYTQKVSGTIWEELLHRAFCDNGLKSGWKDGSHSSGADVSCEEIAISCKSGIVKFKKKDFSRTLQISSHRTQKYKTIEEKAEFINKKHQDIIFSLVRHEKTKEYNLYAFVQPKVSSTGWDENTSKWSWKDENSNKFEITKQTSDQLWMKLSLNNWEKWGKKVYNLGIIE
jgi:hypothetical protein